MSYNNMAEYYDYFVDEEREYCLESYERHLEKERKIIAENVFIKNHGYPQQFDTDFDRVLYQLTFSGNIINLKKLIDYKYKRSGNHNSKRDKVKEFTERSRRRFYEKLCEVVWNDKYCYEITLTYPPEYKTRNIKNDLKKLYDRYVKRFYKKIALIWKLEYTQNGVPHIHGIVVLNNPVELGDYHVIKDDKLRGYDRVTKQYFIDPVKGEREYLQNSWYLITSCKQSEDEKEIEDLRVYNSGTNFEDVRKSGSMPAYLVKYVRKNEKYDKYNKNDYSHKVPEELKPGRFWGIYGRDNIFDRKLFNIDREAWQKIGSAILDYWQDEEILFIPQEAQVRTLKSIIYNCDAGEKLKDEIYKALEEQEERNIKDYE